jgi:hypothetical protein
MRKLFLAALILGCILLGLLIGIIIDRVRVDDTPKVTPSTVRIIMPTPKITENHEEQREKEKEYGKLK